MSKVRKRTGRGALFILALLLAASGALRVGDEFGAALAFGQETSSKEPENTCPAMPSALAAALSAREADVSIQETALAERKAALALADQAIAERLAALTQAEEKLSSTLARADGAAEADLTKLTDVYQAMKPKDAAALFNGMDPQFSAGFLARMRPESAAAIMAGMSTEAAYAASVLLAGRNALVPRE